jgi:ribonuclease P protein component
MKQTLSKSERLKSYTRIRSLFEKGSKLRAQPLLVYYQLYEIKDIKEGSCLQMGVSVSSRHFKRAVDRNLIKRRIREAYRVQKHPLVQALMQSNKHMDLFLVHLGNVIPNYQHIYIALEKLMHQLVTRIPPADDFLPTSKT